MNLTRLFVSVLNMSITACWMVLAVAVCRRLLKKLPHLFSYLLWVVVFVRLVCPVSFTAGFSLLGLFSRGAAASRPVTDQAQLPASSMEWAAPVSAATAGQGSWLAIGAVVWAAVAALLLAWSLVSFLRLRHRLGNAIPIGNRLYLCQGTATPFAFGLWRPAIYLPESLEEAEYSYIIRHEQTHIRRLDHLIKPLAYGIVCLHWFNPLCWLAFGLFCRDMEMSCDEQVVARMGNGIKAQYSRSLLAMASQCTLPNLRLAGFGEHDAKRRIQNVLNYKHPNLKRMLPALGLVVVAALALLANPIKPAVAAVPPQAADQPSISVAPPAPSSQAQTPPAASSSEAPAASSSTQEAPQKISFIWPVDGGYMAAGLNAYYGHTGMDIAAKQDTEIYAAQDGVVSFAVNKSKGAYGKRVDIDHGSDWLTRYAHCSEVLVEEGEEVKQGQLIARMGKTGNATGSMCHFEIRFQNQSQDPADYIGTEYFAKDSQETKPQKTEDGYLYYEF